MSLSATSYFGAVWTASSNYIIDFERGLVTHSKTLTNGQFRRYMKTQSNVQRSDFNPRQAQYYYSAYAMAERYLLFLQRQAHNSLYKLANQASLSYILDHQDLFAKSLQTLGFPVVQYNGTGAVRTRYERQLLVNFMKKKILDSYQYGMLPWQKDSQEAYKQKTINKLRKIAFKQKESTQTSLVPADEE